MSLVADSLIRDLYTGPVAHSLGPGVEIRVEGPNRNPRSEDGLIWWNIYYDFKMFGAARITIDTKELEGLQPDQVLAMMIDHVRKMEGEMREMIDEVRNAWYSKQEEGA